MKSPYIRQDGIILNGGDWLDLGTGVGKFQGCWLNPELGWMSELTYWRTRLKPQERTNVFLTVDRGGAAILERAELAGGPLSRSGSAHSSSAKIPPGCFRRFVRDGWQIGVFEAASADGMTRHFRGWVRGPFGIRLSAKEFSVIRGLTAVACLTHLPTGYRFASFLSIEEAAEIGELLATVVDWGKMKNVDDLEKPEWKDAQLRTCAVWSAAGFGQAMNLRVGQNPVLMRIPEERGTTQ